MPEVVPDATPDTGLDTVGRVAAILTAAGSGQRLGRRLPKALVEVAGEPMLARAARALEASGVVDLLVVTVPRDHQGACAAAMTSAALEPGVPVRLAVGGASRQASVAAGLAVLPDDVDVVLVHDAARALAPSDLVARVVAAVRSGHRAVVPAVPVTDTMVEVELVGDQVGDQAGDQVGDEKDGGDRTGGERVARGVDRARLRAVQTPQGFDRALLVRAHAVAADRAPDEATAATDDASLCALLGEPVTVVAGSPEAVKITTEQDLLLAEALARRADAAARDAAGAAQHADQAAQHAQEVAR